ncbi:hypothetical protein LXA43DRAFT_1064632 [Ganoderma leucocontextum]|nr:hypothetical protein LXA43DRAFT_1064632 [Ganoderma leucocontextum]
MYAPTKPVKIKLKWMHAADTGSLSSEAGRRYIPVDPNANFERHPKCYIPGGDVVLAAKIAPEAEDGLPKYQLFRVHKFLLSLRSPAFANLFADADAAAPNDAYDGVPLIELHGDSPQDLALLLNYIYEPETFLAFRRFDPNAPITITGVARLSDKYLLEPLRKRLVAHVVEEWPTTLRNWDIQQAEIEAITHTIFSVTTVDGDAIDGDQLLSDRIPEPVSAIVFAQEFGCPEILPAAFYRLLQIGFKAHWSHRESHPNPYRYSPLARWRLLDKDNLVKYVLGLHEAEDYAPPIRTFVSVDCRPSFWEGWETDPQAACYLFVENMVNVLGKGRGGTAARDPLHWLKECMEHERFPELLKKHPRGLCDECSAVFYDAVARERQRIWQELLPKWFQLQ